MQRACKIIFGVVFFNACAVFLLWQQYTASFAPEGSPGTEALLLACMPQFGGMFLLAVRGGTVWALQPHHARSNNLFLLAVGLGLSAILTATTFNLLNSFL